MTSLSAELKLRELRELFSFGNKISIRDLDLDKAVQYTLMLVEDDYSVTLKGPSVENDPCENTPRYKIHAEPNFTPEKIVEDFGMNSFIDENLNGLVEKINKYNKIETEISEDTLDFIEGMMQIGLDPSAWRKNSEKYRGKTGSKNATTFLAPYILRYIANKSSESQLPLNISSKSINNFLEVERQYA